MYSYEHLNFCGWIVIWMLMNVNVIIRWYGTWWINVVKTDGVMLTNEIDSTKHAYINASHPIWWIYEDELPCKWIWPYQWVELHFMNQIGMDEMYIIDQNWINDMDLTIVNKFGLIWWIKSWRMNINPSTPQQSQKGPPKQNHQSYLLCIPTTIFNSS